MSYLVSLRQGAGGPKFVAIPLGVLPTRLCGAILLLPTAQNALNPALKCAFEGMERDSAKLPNDRDRSQVLGVKIAALAAGTACRRRLLFETLPSPSAAVDPSGDFDVEAILAPVITPVGFENDVYRLIYLVQGDEEGDEAGSATAFQNDLFILEASQPDQTVTSASTQRVQPAPAAESALSKELRLLGAATPGTAEARMHIVNILPHLATVASDYVKRPEPGVAPTAGLQIQVGSGGGVSMVVSGPAKPERLRNAAVLRPRAGTPIADKAVRVLVFDVMTDVWTDVGFALRQSRNAGTVLDG